MNQAIRIHENGGPEVLRLEDTKVDPPGFGEVLIRHTAVGLSMWQNPWQRGHVLNWIHRWKTKPKSGLRPSNA